MSLPLEKIISGKYEILYKLGEGGMGSVYKVRHRLLDEARVIKVLRPQYAVDEEVRERFRREAKTASRVRHPNIAHLYEFSVDDEGNAYIVMEFIEGITLQEMLRRSGSPGVALAVEIGRQTLAALGQLHKHDIVHRDVAADNLMLTTDYKDDPLVKMIDLGIAKDLGGQAGLTRAGTFMGKARYSAPEQFSAAGGAAQLDRRSDIYSFAVLFYELLTGRCPIEGKNFSEIAAAHLFNPPLSFEESDPEGKVPLGLRQAVLEALEKDPERRTASAEELSATLAEFQRAPKASRDDFTRVLETTSHLTPVSPSPSEAGSTQKRLDRQFGAAEPTPGEARSVGDLLAEAAAESAPPPAEAASSATDAAPSPPRGRPAGADAAPSPTEASQPGTDAAAAPPPPLEARPEKARPPDSPGPPAVSPPPVAAPDWPPRGALEESERLAAQTRSRPPAGVRSTRTIRPPDAAREARRRPWGRRLLWAALLLLALLAAWLGARSLGLVDWAPGPAPESPAPDVDSALSAQGP